ncbi:MAG: hypothetical protein JKY94_16340 [Rhodobacteraceae bacterium]|nr:hypothetical protein [Paracoccaceae bacterium]
MKNLLLAGLICLATSLTCTTSHAKSMAKILSDSGLSPRDFTIMTEQAETLYVAVTPRKGASTKWQNDDSQSYGVVQLVAVQGNCVLLRHLVHPKGIQKAREIRTRRCKTSEGNWILQ